MFPRSFFPSSYFPPNYWEAKGKNAPAKHGHGKGYGGREIMEWMLAEERARVDAMMLYERVVEANNSLLSQVVVANVASIFREEVGAFERNVAAAGAKMDESLARFEQVESERRELERLNKNAADAMMVLELL